MGHCYDWCYGRAYGGGIFLWVLDLYVVCVGRVGRVFFFNVMYIGGGWGRGRVLTLIGICCI